MFMAGRKFGTQDNEDQTWAMNVIVPGNVAEHFANSRIVAFSSGCVYPFVHPESGGCTESYPTDPLGEYAQSCVGRERIFQFYSDRQETRMIAPPRVVDLVAIDPRRLVDRDPPARVAGVTTDPDPDPESEVYVRNNQMVTDIERSRASSTYEPPM